MSGKWHLDSQSTDFGFDRYFGHLSGAYNYFSGNGSFRLNGKPWSVPKTPNGKPFYTTVAKVDYALDFLAEARAAEKPFYLYVAFNAPHAPLHALPEDYAKYQGRYDAGWDKIRDARICKQKELGLLPVSLEPSPRPPHVPAWDTLVDWQRDHEINRMRTLAAMIDRIDQEVGRLVEDLRKNGELENSLILLVSDNGASPYDRGKPRLGVEPTNAETSLKDSTGWAWARNAPFRFYKQNQFEGEISTPGIVHWPAGLKTRPGAVIDTPVHLIDVLPTLADLAAAKAPTEHSRRKLRPVSGISLRPIFEGSELRRSEPIHFHFASDLELRDGDWKIVSFKGQEWELYDLGRDRTELNDLAEAEPKRLQAMVAKWKEMSRDVLHSPLLDSPKIKPAVHPRSNPEWTVFGNQGTPSASSAGKPSRRANGASMPTVRARKNTELSRLADGALKLTFTGEDPGITMDLRGWENLPSGPYALSFKLTTPQQGEGEIRYTLDFETNLTRGQRIWFPLGPANEPHAVKEKIETDKSLKQLRIGITEGPGSAIIRDLQLRDAKEAVLIDWTLKPGE
ncbi:Arylsulfatase [Pirellulimonas nuda]|uniref:Arylsulfatase n=2 Tax=Pirellulimonas nuda TaxID=2528009 RepID=A0A518DAB5_9BACT|nr:Arylsulfatase [Pirellulimonas nuda]